MGRLWWGSLRSGYHYVLRKSINGIASIFHPDSKRAQERREKTETSLKEAMAELETGLQNFGARFWRSARRSESG